MSVPVMGNHYEISAGSYTATITEVGAGLRGLNNGSESLVLTYPEDSLAPGGMGQLLMPWPNRIDHGAYEFGGERYRLTITEAAHDNAIHGLVRWDNWTVTEYEPHRILLIDRLHGRPGYPFCLGLSAEYTLDSAGGLTVTLTARNAGSRPAPYGHGAHPYLTVGRPLDECLLTVSGTRYQPVSERSIPVGPPRDVRGSAFDFLEPRPIAGAVLDTPYTGLRRDSDGRAWIKLSDPSDGRTVGMWADSRHPWLQAFTADTMPAGLRRTGLAAEPMTCPPNAFAGGTDLIVLKPGDEFTGRWGIMSL